MAATETKAQIPLPPLMEGVKSFAIDELHSRLHAEGFDDVRPGHGCVFRFVGPEGIRLTELAEANRMSKQAVGEVVSDLEHLGYVERVPDPGDRRAKIIRLTARGATAQATAGRIFAEIEEAWAGLVGSERITLLRELLTELAAALELDDSGGPRR